MRTGLPLRGVTGTRNVRSPTAYDFVPLSHETFGRMSGAALQHLKYLAAIAEECGLRDHAQYVTN